MTAVVTQSDSSLQESTQHSRIVLKFDYNGTVSWLLKEGTQIETGNIELTAISEIEDKITNAQYVIILLKGIDVDVRTVIMPQNAPEDQLLELTKFEIEEELLEDVAETQLYVIHQHEGIVTVAIISKEIVSHINNIFKTVPANKLIVVPDFLAVPFNENTWTFFILNEYSLIRYQHFLGFSWETKSLDQIMSILIDRAEKLPQAITIYGQVTASIEETISKLGVNIIKKDPLDLLMYTSDSTLPMIDVKISATKNIHFYEEIRASHLKKYLLYSVSILLFFLVSFQIVKTIYLNHLLHQLQQDEMKMLTYLYPEETNASKLRQQFESDITEFNSNSSYNFFHLFSSVGAVLKGLDQQSVISISYNEDALNLELQFNSFSQLEAPKAKLLEKGFIVEQRNADTTQGKVIAELIVAAG